MKRCFYILFLLLIFDKSISQVLPFPQKDMQQIYGGSMCCPFVWWKKYYRYVNDTSINGINMNRFLYIGIQSDSVDTNYFSGIIYTYSLSDHIYVLESDTNGTPTGTVYYKYNFALNIGDTVSLDSCHSLWGMVTVEADSIGIATMQNAQSRKYLRVHDEFASSNIHEWFDGIGSLRNGFFGGCGFIDSQEVLACHSDSSGFVYAPDTSVCNSLNDFFAPFFSSFFTSMDPLNISATEFQIYPNPATSQITVEHKLKAKATDAAVVFYNVMGEEIIRFKITGETGASTIDISNISSGIIFYSIVVNNNAIARDKVVIIH